MSQDEITVMDGAKCIFQLRGVRPFLSDKFDITKHKNYKRYLRIMTKKNVFDMKAISSEKEKSKTAWRYGDYKSVGKVCTV